MTTTRQIVGALMVTILIPIAVRAQDGTATNPPAPPVAVGDVSSMTNPPAAVPLTIPGPAEPQITTPHPAQIDIPSATAQPSANPEPQFRVRAMPLALPTTQEALTKSMQSAPGGSQDRLKAIAAAQLALAPPTNASPFASSAAAEPLTNAPVGQSTNIWQKNTPLLNGVDYHW